MINKKDYEAYIKQNDTFINLLKKTCPILYDRLYDVVKVLDHITKTIEKDNKIDEENLIIFESGFSFIHEQIEEMKTYYYVYFREDKALFQTYAVFINYILYLNDLKDTIYEKGGFSKDVLPLIEKFLKEIDDIIFNQKNNDTTTLDEYNIYLEGHVPVGTLTTVEVFALISEELGL